MVRKTMVFESIFSQIKDEQPTNFWNFLALHSSQTEKINLKDFVILAERMPLSSPTRSSLLQFVYGFCDKSCTFFERSFLRWRYFLACSKNSEVKYGL
jgi:hypothetical protein